MAVSTDRIVLSAQPRGVFEEITIVGTPKPGTVMVIVPGQTAVNDDGRWDYEPAGTTAASGTQGMGADGDRIPIAVLIEDALQGRAVSTAYATGDRGRVYYPAVGEELNMLMQNAAGTGDDLTVGDPLIVDDGTGKVLKSAGTPETEPFMCLQVVTDPTADQLIWTKFTGN